MKTKNIFKTLALAMLMPTMLLTTACSSEDDVVNSNIANIETVANKGYALPVTVNVTREGDKGSNRASYNDNGESITCVWETADISQQLFYKKKTYRYVALRCMPEISSSVQIWAQKDGQWTLLKNDIATLKYLSFENLTFSKMTFSCNRTQRVTSAKIRLKKLPHVRFRFINDLLNEPLGVNDFAVEYTQAGNIK